MSTPDFSTPFLTITYRPDLDQLAGRWQRPVREDELHAGYEALQSAAHHYQCRRWLVDARRRTDRRLNGPEWVTTQFLPQVQQELGGPLAVCFLVLPDYLASLPAEPAPAGPLHYARFTDEGQASAWLAAQPAGGS